MKLVRVSTTLYNFKTQLGGLRNVLGSASYSKAKRAASRNKEETLWRGSMSDLYGMISPIGDPTVSIVPLLDKWVAAGRPVDKSQLRIFIRELRSRRRFAHALEISTWMTNKGKSENSVGDIVIRLDLITKVKGIEQAENYFCNIPKKLRGCEVYRAFIDCCASDTSVEKAEVIIQQMRDLGLVRKTIDYNSMVKFYYQTGSYKKLDSLMQEMKEKGIFCDKYTYGICLSACAATSDSEGIDKTVSMMESDPNVVLNWTIYATAANGYAKVGCLDKALALLKKSEGLIMYCKVSRAYDYLITQYAVCGSEDDVLRVWELYRKNLNMVNNMSYICILPSVLKFDDLATAEKIFEDWGFLNLRYDMRIPNFLIGAYCRKGLLQKAETLINEAKRKGGKPNLRTWYIMTTGYLENNQTEKAVEAMKEALAVYRTRSHWKPSVESLVGCLDYFKDKRDIEGAENFIELLRVKDIIPADTKYRLLKNVENEQSNLNALMELCSESLVGTEEALAEPEDASSDLTEEMKAC